MDSGGKNVSFEPQPAMNVRAAPEMQVSDSILLHTSNWNFTVAMQSVW